MANHIEILPLRPPAMKLDLVLNGEYYSMRFGDYFATVACQAFVKEDLKAIVEVHSKFIEARKDSKVIEALYSIHDLFYAKTNYKYISITVDMDELKNWNIKYKKELSYSGNEMYEDEFMYETNVKNIIQNGFLINSTDPDVAVKKLTKYSDQGHLDKSNIIGHIRTCLEDMSEKYGSPFYPNLESHFTSSKIIRTMNSLILLMDIEESIKNGHESSDFVLGTNSEKMLILTSNGDLEEMKSSKDLVKALSVVLEGEFEQINSKNIHQAFVKVAGECWFSQYHEYQLNAELSQQRNKLGM